MQAFLYCEGQGEQKERMFFAAFPSLAGSKILE